MNKLQHMIHLRCTGFVLLLATVTTLILVACSGTIPPATSSTSTPVTTVATATATTAPEIVQVSIGIQHGSFAFAGTIVVPKGSTVRWLNETDALHTVTSDNGAFLGSGTFGRGQTYTVIFNTAGTFAYHCALHPYMKAQIIVTG